MPWNDDFVTGLELIDEQHHWLVDQTNRLYEEINKDQVNREMVHEVLEGLVDYAINHFIAEEVLFQQYEYPENDSHKAEHDGFSKQAASLLQRHEEGGDVTNEVMEFLKNWLKHLILEEDMAYVPFIKSKMVG